MTKNRSKKKSTSMTNANTIYRKTEEKGEVLLCWCDGGLTDGKFTEGLVYTLITTDVPVVSAMRVQGNQIGRQRQTAFDNWLDNTNYEWILWVDSDIELTREILHKLWTVANKDNVPVVSGVYFISKENEKSVMTPYPAVFSFTEDRNKIAYLHPLPQNALVRVGAAGFGLLLMHRSVGEKMRMFHGVGKPFFNETGVGEQFVSEDINFFYHMAEADIPLFTHTGATAKHMKRFAYDLEYYKMFWSAEDAT
jgi:hypothetical protein